MSKTVSKVGAVAGTMILAGSGMFVALPALAEEAPSSAGVEAAAAVAQEGEASEASQAAVPQKVEGTFSYSQDVITDNATITNVFKKAMATLCTGLPQYAVQEVQTMVITGGSTIEATVEDLASEDGAASYTVGCACSSNVAGSGAIVNADVSGVSLATVAQRVGAV